jgi:hypothetical protein
MRSYALLTVTVLVAASAGRYCPVTGRPSSVCGRTRRTCPQSWVSALDTSCGFAAVSPAACRAARMSRGVAGALSVGPFWRPAA